jgi:hypothetical protein
MTVECLWPFVTDAVSTSVPAHVAPEQLSGTEAVYEWTLTFPTLSEGFAGGGGGGGGGGGESVVNVPWVPSLVPAALVATIR